jgi:hypothetical protein
VGADAIAATWFSQQDGARACLRPPQLNWESPSM